MRIGQSTDIHPLKQGRELWLGGIHIPSPIGLDGHSDGDALLHAIAEAILGALGKKDLGTYFKDTDPKSKGQSSRMILQEVYQMMIQEGYCIGNVDSLILVELIRMAPYLDQMIEVIAQDLHTERSNINVKATRGEKLGFIGRGEGIQAQAVVLLKKIV